MIAMQDTGIGKPTPVNLNGKILDQRPVGAECPSTLSISGILSEKSE